MGTQVSYPGIYVQEFTPGAPIQGVGESTGAFIGTASMGPINQPTFITSWDEFQTMFGGFISESPNLPASQRSWLAPAVYGFFLNQGTGCYIIRAVGPTPSSSAPALPTSLMASYALLSQTPLSKPDLVATAIAEGSIGNSISVTVRNSSLLASMLGAPALKTIAAPLVAGQLSIPVDLSAVPASFVLSQALPGGALIQVGGAAGEFVTVASAGVSAPNVGTITLTSGLVAGYAAATSVASLEFDLVVTGATTETWTFLSMNPVHPGYWQTVVKSQIITLSLPATPPGFPLPPPVSNTNPVAGGPFPLTGGLDDVRTKDLAYIDQKPDTFLNLLVPLQDVDLVAIPGNVTPNTQAMLVNHCETLFNRFAILDGVQDVAPYSNLKAQYGHVRAPNGFAAIYFPWIQVVNPLNGVTEYWPPSGHITGIHSFSAETYGVYKAPANVPIAGALGLQALLTNADQGPLNLLGINILRVFPEQSQPLVWGARTTSTDSDWQYINIRRLFIYLEQSIEQGIRWAVFQPNNQFLWGQLTRTINEFLGRVENDGGIIDYYVRINAALNPPATQALGQLFIEVGIQPTYPAEFIILKIGIWQGGSSVTES